MEWLAVARGGVVVRAVVQAGETEERRALSPSGSRTTRYYHYLEGTPLVAVGYALVVVPLAVEAPPRLWLLPPPPLLLLLVADKVAVASPVETTNRCCCRRFH